MRTLAVSILIAAASPVFAQAPRHCEERLVAYKFSDEQKAVVQRLLSIEPPKTLPSAGSAFWEKWPTVRAEDKEIHIACWRAATHVLADLQRSFWENVNSAYQTGDGSLSADLGRSLIRASELPDGAKVLFAVPDIGSYKAQVSAFISGVAAQREVVWMGTKIPPNLLKSELVDTTNWTRVEDFIAQGIAER